MGVHRKEQVCILHLAPVFFLLSLFIITEVIVPGGQGTGGKRIAPVR